MHPLLTIQHIFTSHTFCFRASVCIIILDIYVVFCNSYTERDARPDRPQHETHKI